MFGLFSSFKNRFRKKQDAKKLKKKQFYQSTTRHSNTSNIAGRDINIINSSTSHVEVTHSSPSSNYDSGSSYSGSSSSCSSSSSSCSSSSSSSSCD